MNWNNVKEAARNGIKSSFISDKDKEEALKVFSERIRIIERLVTEERDNVKIEKLRQKIRELPEAA